MDADFLDSSSDEISLADSLLAWRLLGVAGVVFGEGLLGLLTLLGLLGVLGEDLLAAGLLAEAGLMTAGGLLAAAGLLADAGLATVGFVSCRDAAAEVLLFRSDMAMVSACFRSVSALSVGSDLCFGGLPRFRRAGDGGLDSALLCISGSIASKMRCASSPVSAVFVASFGCKRLTCTPDPGARLAALPAAGDLGLVELVPVFTAAGRPRPLPLPRTEAPPLPRTGAVAGFVEPRGEAISGFVGVLASETFTENDVAEVGC